MNNSSEITHGCRRGEAKFTKIGRASASLPGRLRLLELVRIILNLISILTLSAGAESISSRYNEPYPVAASKKG
jgi:hypothetical protein